MPGTLEQISEDALTLPLSQRLILAERLLESTDVATGSDVEATWDAKIRARLQAVKSGSVASLSYDEVMREANERLGA